MTPGSLFCIYLERWVNLFVLQMWMSVRTQPTVRMATVWTLQGRTTASAPRPGPWPPTVTVVWLLKSKLVSADTLWWEGCEEQQGSGGKQQFILETEKQSNHSVGCLHFGRQYTWGKTDFRAKLNKEGEGICQSIVIVLNRGKNRKSSMCFHHILNGWRGFFHHFL